MKNILSFILLALGFTAACAEETKLQDMSDPLAVYTQVGTGLTNKGLNIKIGKSYDPNVPKTMAMNVFEIKGIFGKVRQ